MRRKTKRKIKNFILRTYAAVVGFIWCYAACSLDSPTWTPVIVLAITSLLLIWFAWANGAFEEYMDK